MSKLAMVAGLLFPNSSRFRIIHYQPHEDYILLYVAHPAFEDPYKICIAKAQHESVTIDDELTFNMFMKLAGGDINES